MFENPLRRISEEEQEEMGLRYYDSDVHKASFTLPRFARKVDTLMVASYCTCYRVSLDMSSMTVKYCVAGNFHWVQFFVIFVDLSATVKI